MPSALADFLKNFWEKSVITKAAISQEFFQKKYIFQCVVIFLYSDVSGEQQQESWAAGQQIICRAVKIRSGAAATARQIYVKK